MKNFKCKYSDYFEIIQIIFKILIRMHGNFLWTSGLFVRTGPS